MRKNIPHIACLLCLAFGLAACEKIEPDFYDEGANGAYFDYGYASDFERVLNFSDHIVGHPDTVTLLFLLVVELVLKQQLQSSSQLQRFFLQIHLIICGHKKLI